MVFYFDGLVFLRHIPPLFDSQPDETVAIAFKGGSLDSMQSNENSKRPIPFFTRLERRRSRSGAYTVLFDTGSLCTTVTFLRYTAGHPLTLLRVSRVAIVCSLSPCCGPHPLVLDTIQKYSWSLTCFTNVRTRCGGLGYPGTIEQVDVASQKKVVTTTAPYWTHQDSNSTL